MYYPSTEFNCHANIVQVWHHGFHDFFQLISHFEHFDWLEIVFKKSSKISMIKIAFIMTTNLWYHNTSVLKDPKIFKYQTWYVGLIWPLTDTGQKNFSIYKIFLNVIFNVILHCLFLNHIHICISKRRKGHQKIYWEKS